MTFDKKKRVFTKIFIDPRILKVNYEFNLFLRIYTIFTNSIRFYDFILFLRISFIFTSLLQFSFTNFFYFYDFNSFVLIYLNLFISQNEYIFLQTSRRSIKKNEFAHNS